MTSEQLCLPVQRPRTAGEPGTLSAARGAALYIGALLGPGLLLLPGLAAAEAGPASIIAWLGLLGLSALFAVVFAALGRAYPLAGGAPGYTAAGLGGRAGTVAGTCFLAGVVCGAPLVCLIGATYVTDLTGGGSAVRCAIAAGLLLTILALASGGMRATTAAQLVLVSLLTLVIVVAIAGTAPAARAANWSPFAPRGWLSVGRAASTLMFSFVGWEAVAPLTGRFRDPARQLPRVIGAALAVTTIVYLGLAIVTIAVLGKAAATDVPLAALLTSAAGAAGRPIAVVVAVVLTLGATNAYLSGAVTMARARAQCRPGAGGGALARQRSGHRFLAVVALAGVALLGLYGARLVTTAELVGLPTALFLIVYLGCTLAAARTLRGAVRACAAIAFAAVLVLLAFCGWALAAAAVVALAASMRRWAPSLSYRCRMCVRTMFTDT
ncbi:MAG TPA: APC family permease [Trebonia sp.]|jgi:amino acid efflux transporter|nr:APC family permease [Trebonia sp.]